MEILLSSLPWIFLPLGMLFGSLANVIIYRLPVMMAVVQTPEHSNINLWWPPSHCVSCKENIKPWDNIPVISWFILKGKCRKCDQPISALYPISEATMGVAWAGLAFLFSDNVSLLMLTAIAGLFTVLYILSVIDMQHLILPDSLVYLVLWSGLLLVVSGHLTINVEDAIYGVVLAWLSLWGIMIGWFKVRKYEGLGNGDVKLYAACGAWIGWQQLPLLLLSSAVFGIVFWLIVRVCQQQNEQQPVRYIPFGPAIAIAAFSLIVIGEMPG